MHLATIILVIVHIILLYSLQGGPFLFPTSTVRNGAIKGPICVKQCCPIELSVRMEGRSALANMVAIGHV